MSQSSFQIDSKIVIQTEWEPNQSQALRVGVATHLKITVKFTFNPPTKCGLGESDVIYTLLTGHLLMSYVQGKGDISLGAIEPLQIQKFFSYCWKDGHSFPHSILVPLSYQIIETIEQHPKGDIHLTLDLHLGTIIFGPAQFSTGLTPTDPPRLSDARTAPCRLLPASL